MVALQKECKSCRISDLEKMLENAPILAIGGVDTVENGQPKVRQVTNKIRRNRSYRTSIASRASSTTFAGTRCGSADTHFKRGLARCAEQRQAAEVRRIRAAVGVNPSSFFIASQNGPQQFD